VTRTVPRRGHAGRRTPGPRAAGGRGTGRWKTHDDERKPPPDASPAPVTPGAADDGGPRGIGEEVAGDGEIAGRGRPGGPRCRKPSTGCGPWSTCPSIPRQCRGRRRATADRWRDRLESDLRRGRGSFPPQPSPWKSAAAIPASRCSKRWDRLRAGLDLILDQRGADVLDLPGGASGMLARGYKGMEPTGW
jgi:hypothetical protein